MDNQRSKRSNEFPTVKRRNFFTREDKCILSDYFAMKSYPDQNDFNQIVKLLNKDEKKIRHWFAVKRSRENKIIY